MSSIFTALKLVNSLSASEKRHFKLVSSKQNGEKDYQGLFQIIEANSLLSPVEISDQYKTEYPGSSLDNASRYLIKVITDSLIQTKIEKDNTFELLHNLMRVKIFQERSLSDEAYHELKKVRKTAELSQNHMMQYVASRYELDHLSSLNFPEMTDTHLVDMQMKAKESLRTVQHIEGHYALYELLKYRLIHQGGIASEEEKKQLNDLLLSELSLVTGKAKNTFQSKKLHLLFQSFFFTHTGDHKSALKTFNELNKHFERNPELQEHPPISYYSSLDGILDSMRSAGNFEEMPFYIGKMENIDTSSGPDHFRYLLQITIAVYTLVAKMNASDYNGAVDYVNSLDSRLFEAYHLINVEKRWELYFYCGLAYFGKKDYKKALKFVRGITAEDSKHVLLPIYKAIRILNIIIHYELRNTTLVTSEIRSYKRFFQQKTKLFKSEKLVFKVIQLDPCVNTGAKNKSLVPKISLYCKTVHADKYERTLLKYFDLTKWALSKFSRRLKNEE
jgi:hypothetical protein